MNLVRIMVALPLAGTLLAGCGGSGGGSAAPAQAGQSSQSGSGSSVGVGEPNGTALAILPFTAMARGAACADATNRLYVIDGKQVFWDRAGKCADASHEQVLYGAKLDTVLCTQGDSIAGPRGSCQDASAKLLFDTIVANLDKPDLGLGSGHKVERIGFLPQAGATVGFGTVASNTISGVATRRNVVIRDQASWEKLWAEHATKQLPPPALPNVDFTRQMLVGVFSGTFHDACYGLSIAAVHAGADKLVVEVDERGPRMGVACSQVAVNPMHVVAVDRIDADVDFVVTPTVDVAFDTLATTSHSEVFEEQNVVVRDADAFARLWARFDQHEPAPQVDFGSKMVVGVFMGTRPNACYGTGVAGIAHEAGQLRVRRVDQVPGEGIMCAQVITTPAQLVVLDKSELPVAFSTDVMSLRR